MGFGTVLHKPLSVHWYGVPSSPVSELTAKRNQVFTGATSLPYLLLGHVVARLVNRVLPDVGRSPFPLWASWRHRFVSDCCLRRTSPVSHPQGMGHEFQLATDARACRWSPGR